MVQLTWSVWDVNVLSCDAGGELSEVKGRCRALTVDRAAWLEEAAVAGPPCDFCDAADVDEEKNSKDALLALKSGVGDAKGPEELTGADGDSKGA